MGRRLSFGTLGFGTFNLYRYVLKEALVKQTERGELDLVV